MSSQEEFDHNRNYYLAVQYLLKLLERGSIDRTHFRKANRYFADKFETTMRIFV